MRALEGRAAAAAIILALLAVAAAGCGRDEASRAPPLFAEAAAGRGLSVPHDRGAAGRRHLFEAMGGGVAWIDHDGDGNLDIFFPRGQPMAEDGTFPRRGVHRLLRNEGRTFRDATAEAGLSELDGYGLGAAAGDVDGDGDPDLYLVRFGPNALLVNESGVFRERADAGVACPEPFSGGAAFGDLDGDGHLDLFVTGYLEVDAASAPACSETDARRGIRIPTYCGPHNFPGAMDRLFLGRGDGTFRDASAACGLVAPGLASSKSLGVLLADLDDDRDVDVFVACDTTANLYYENAGGGRFVERGLQAGLAAGDTGSYEGGMGIAAGDADGDGRIDLFITNYEGEPNRLHRALGGGIFEDAMDRLGAGERTHPLVGWGCAFGDLDLDGRLDLAIANGHVFDNVEEWSPGESYRQPGLLHLRDGTSGRFIEAAASAAPDLASAASRRGLALADWDNDGDLDLLAVTLDEGLLLLENRTAGGARRGLSVELAGAGQGGRDAVGARVDLISGGPPQTRWRTGGGSYLSANDPRLHFTLDGNGPASFRVTWPDGAVETFVAPAGRAVARFTRGGP